MKRLALFLLLAVALGLLWFLTTRSRPPSAGAVAPTPPPSASAAPPSNIENQESNIPLGSPATDIAADLRLLDSLLENFRTNFPRDGNPVGTNAEITAALTGANPLRLALLPRDHPAINQRGELCDRWGTPFFFHQLSGAQMEIRSAGPDGKFHTPDDTVLTP